MGFKTKIELFKKYVYIIWVTSQTEYSPPPQNTIRASKVRRAVQTHLLIYPSGDCVASPPPIVLEDEEQDLVPLRSPDNDHLFTLRLNRTNTDFGQESRQENDGTRTVMSGS